MLVNGVMLQKQLEELQAHTEQQTKVLENFVARFGSSQAPLPLSLVMLHRMGGGGGWTPKPSWSELSGCSRFCPGKSKLRH